MADDSELDYIRTFLAYASFDSTVKHYSEIRKISAIDDTRRILIYPGELLSVDGKFYKKRYKVQISETSEANLMETFNNIIEAIDDLSKGLIGIDNNYTGIYFDISVEITSPQGICWDGTYFWILDYTAKRVYKYNSAGVYQSINFDISGEDSEPSGIIWDGTYFWTVGAGNRKVYKYSAAGVYESTFFFVGSECTAPIGLAWDGTYFWVIGLTNIRVYKYTSVGVYTGVSFDVSNEDGFVTDIAWDGTYLWVLGDGNNTAFKYTIEGVYTNIYIDYGSEETGAVGITNVGSFLWIVGSISEEAYKYHIQIYPNKPNVLVYIDLKYSNIAYENGKTKRWYQDFFLDIEWCIS